MAAVIVTTGALVLPLRTVTAGGVLVNVEVTSVATVAVIAAAVLVLVTVGQ